MKIAYFLLRKGAAYYILVASLFFVLWIFFSSTLFRVMRGEYLTAENLPAVIGGAIAGGVFWGIASWFLLRFCRKGDTRGTARR